MHRFQTGCALSLAMLAAATSAWAGSPTQVGASGRTYASSGVLCLADPATGVVQAAVDTSLLQPSSRTKGVVTLYGQREARLSASQPGIYSFKNGSQKSRRRVSRDPSNN